MTFEMSIIGRYIGNYRIIAEIGCGGFARVYRGEHLLLKERTVAIKFLHTYLRSPEEGDRFLQEARILEKLRHHHILLIYDVGIDQGFPYLVAEYAPNGSLRDRLNRAAHHPLPTEDVVSILSQIGQALHFAHQQHIIHRDLKPENILFNQEDQALLADFGIATILTSASLQSAKLIGTPSYMAPEQFAGNVCKESDQYSLGCIGYELVTGCLPFSADNVFATGFKHLNETPPAPTQLNPSLPAYLEHAILTAMAKERSNRYPNLPDFISALHGATFSPSPITLTSVPISQPPLLPTAPSALPSSPVLASTQLQHAFEEIGEETTPPPSHQNTSESTRYTIPPRQYQESFPPSHQGSVTLSPLLKAEQFLGTSRTTSVSLSESQPRGKYSTWHRWLILSIAGIILVASIIASLLFVAFPVTSQGSGSMITATQTAKPGSHLPSLTSTSNLSGTPSLKPSQTPTSHAAGKPASTATATLTSSRTKGTTGTATATPTASPTILPTVDPTPCPKPKKQCH